MELNNVVQEFELIAGKYPGEVAIAEHERTYSYQDLSGHIDEFGRLLIALGLKKAQVVGVVLPSGFSLISSMMAIFKTGGIYLPMTKEFQLQRLVDIFAEISSGIIVTDSRSEEMVRKIASDSGAEISYIIIAEGTSVRVLEGRDWLPAKVKIDTSISFPVINGDDPNYIFYSSGSTGEGKPILGQHIALRHFILWEIKEFGIGPAKRLAQLGQITFDASLKDILSSICSGATLCIPPPGLRYNIPALLQWIEKHEVTIVQITPSLLRQITRYLQQYPDERRALKSLTNLMLSGEMVYSNDIQKIKQYFGEDVLITNLYGSTESTILKTFHKIQTVPEDPGTPIHVGKPIDDTTVAILNNGRICNPGEIGEIYIKTKFLTKGYYKRPEDTSKIFVQNPLVNNRESIIYKTGDQGRYTSDGNIEVIGRLDDQVKIHGIRVHLKDIEQKILAIEGMDEAVVLKRSNTDFTDELICFYSSAALDENTVRTILAGNLHTSLMPGMIIRLEKLPYNINGKVDKSKLLRISNATGYEQGEKCRTDLEKSLERLWVEILGGTGYARNKSFFHVGGSSLKAIQLIYKIHKAHNVVVTIGDIFRNSTIEELASIIEKSLSNGISTIPAIEEQQYYSLSHAQKRHVLLESDNSSFPVYNMTTVIAMNKKLDVGLLQQAFDILINRHDVLRSNFVILDGQPKQLIYSKSRFRIEVLNGKFNHEDVSRYIQKELTTKFDLQHDSLLRCTLLSLDDENILIVSIHHAICDAWSARIIINELSQSYNKLHDRSEPNHSPLKVQYKDYAAWANQKLAQQSLQQRSFWIKSLENYTDLTMPTDYKRSEKRSFKGNKIFFELTAEQVAKIDALCAELKLSRFIFFFGILKVTIARFSGQKDLVIGTAITNREHPELETQIGVYLNNLPVRTIIQPEDTFTNFVITLKSFMANAYDNALYPYDMLVEDLLPRPVGNRNPLYDVLFVMDGDQSQSSREGSAEFERFSKDLAVQPLHFDDRVSKLDLTFFCYHRKNILFMIEYSVELYKESTISRISEDYKAIVNMVTGNPQCLVGDLLAFHSTTQDESIYLDNISEISAQL